MPVNSSTNDVDRVARIAMPYTPPVIREDYLVGLCQGKKVLHVGCTDSPFTRQKFGMGLLLHEKLRAVSSRLVGIDLDGDAIAWLTAQGISDLYVADATDMDGFLERIGFQPDVVLAGEVIEHLSNPGLFLAGIRKAIPRDAQLIVTVPSAFAYFSILQMILGREKVHPDHVAYYSFGTLRELLNRHGFLSEKILPCRNQEMRSLDKVLHFPFHLMLRLFPHFSSGYVAIARPSDRK